MGILGVDIGTKNLAWCICDRGRVIDWFLIDLAKGRFIRFNSTSGHSETQFQGCGSKATIQGFTGALVEFCRVWAETNSVEHAEGRGTSITRVIVEAQLGMHNIKAKVLGHAIQTWALLTLRGATVQFERPHGARVGGGKVNYKQRKDRAIESCRAALVGQPLALDWLDLQTKKDDLSDSYLLASQRD